MASADSKAVNETGGAKEWHKHIHSEVPVGGWGALWRGPGTSRSGHRTAAEGVGVGPGARPPGSAPGAATSSRVTVGSSVSSARWEEDSP